MADLNYFVFTVASVGGNIENYFRSDERLDGLKNSIPQIKNALGNEARLESDPNNLILKDFLIYAGSGQNSEVLIGDLPRIEIEPPAIISDRYGRPFFVGLAAGRNIFNKNPTEEQRHENEKRFNHFLDEIFRTIIVVENENGIQESFQYKEIPDYGDFKNRPADPPPWEGGWTVFRVPEGYNFMEMVMAGHSC